MPTNRQLAAEFQNASAILEITGANAFKTNAIARVARILQEYPSELAPIASDLKALQAIDGIGKSSAEKIAECCETGSIAEFTALRESIPAGLIDVLGLSGLGPKTVRTLWTEGGVTDIASLKSAIAEGRLDGLPRMGPKTIAKFSDAITFAEKSSGRMRLGDALPLAEAIVARVGNARGVSRIAYAGSLRRGRETIGDIDILVASADPASPTQALTTMPGVDQVLVSGETKTSVRLTKGVQVDLRIVPESLFGAALLYFTGSKEHNVMLRELAIAKDMRLNEYGLFPNDGESASPHTRGVDPVAAASERDIYNALGLPMLPPELRENRNPRDWTVPEDLVSVASINAELHCHTNASDGSMTLEQLVEQARTRGFHTIAVTDHSRSSAQANGLSIERLREQMTMIRQYNETLDDITVLCGSEVDILADGTLDYPDEVLAELDWVICSPHVSLRQAPDVATARLLCAIEHPLVHAIGHPTGRLINRREGLSPDMPTLIAAAKQHRTALELNANPWRLDLRDAHVRLASEAGTYVTIDTDAHGPSDFELLKYGVLTGRRGGLTQALCPNCWDDNTLHEWIRSKR